MSIDQIVTHQHDFFQTGATRPVKFRLEALKKLQSAIVRDEAKIIEALKMDLNKTHYEGYMTEIGIVLDEIRFAIRHIRSWVRSRTVPTPLAQFHAKSFIVPDPFGVVLIMAPWNYPFQLCLEPLIGALAAGNCAVIKPSANAPHTARAVADLIAACFPPEYIVVIDGDRSKNPALLEQRFDYIFFTGSAEVGKMVMTAAAKNLTPVSLELGGKSPCIVDQTADLELAARRLAFGKYLNSGQACVAPDYLLVHRSVKDAFVRHLIAAVETFFPDSNYNALPVIINDKHFRRLLGLIQGEDIRLGGGSDAARRFIEPTILDNITFNSPVMQEEIFGPILPVIIYDTLDEAIEMIQTRPCPLALYLFTRDRAVEKLILSSLPFGGGCINDTIIHFATPHMAFGGVGHSGMGSYHGRKSFETFTHFKSIVRKSNWIDLPMRYHPYSQKSLALLKMFLR